jgi:hypothetical protein
VLDEAEKEREEQLRQKLQKNVVLAREMVEGDRGRVVLAL